MVLTSEWAGTAQRDRFHNHYQYLFIESICNDTAVLEQNYRYKMMYSPDYAGFRDAQVNLHPHNRLAALTVHLSLRSMCEAVLVSLLVAVQSASTYRQRQRCCACAVLPGASDVSPPSAALQAALDDFRDRITRYEEVYETITNRDLHYIKLIDMWGPGPARPAPPPPLPARAAALPQPPSPAASRQSLLVAAVRLQPPLGHTPTGVSETPWPACRVTGRGYMDVNRISGYIPGKIVFFLMQARSAAQARLLAAVSPCICQQS